MNVKKCIVSVLIVVAWACLATMFYKTVMLMLLFLIWKKQVFERLPSWMTKYGMKPYWACFVVFLWIAMPRYRINSGDRVRLVYLDEKGNAKHPPLGQYLVNTFIPEEEIVNVGIHNVPLLKYAGIGSTLIRQANDDIANGKIRNFFYAYDNLGYENPMSGVYAQAFHDFLGNDDRAVYICEPKSDENVKWSKDNGFKYPLVVFCHGYLGNWQLYQGVWKDLDNCIVLSISTQGLSGIFTQSDIKDIFDFYIPALERMGYNIDKKQLHLMGLSNGGTAIISAMHSSYAKKFKSITTVSCNLEGLRRVPCQVNFIGGGKDNSSCRMPGQCRQLKAMGVDADIYFKEDENHFIMVDKHEEIIGFLMDRMQLKCVRMEE